MRKYMQSFLKDTIMMIHRGLSNGETLSSLRSKIQSSANQLPYLNVRNRAALVSGMMSLARKGLGKKDDDLVHSLTIRKNFQIALGSINQAERASYGRWNRARIDLQLKTGREQNFPTIFYLSSTHQNPAKDHEDWQGVIFVDRFWRDALSSSGHSDIIPSVEAYIRNRDVQTVQWVVGAPVYLTTRPNCRHFFLPISINEALKSSPSAIRKAHSDQMLGVPRPVSDRARYLRREAIRKGLKNSMLNKSKVSVS